MANKITKIAFLVIFFLVGSISIASAASWSSTRDAAMTLRERGQATEAYRMVASATPRSARDITDQQFLAGYLALRFLNRPDIAIEHFKEMAGRVNTLPSNERSNQRSQAGYWLGMTLTALGKHQEAQQMHAAAAAYRDTFYGQLSGSIVGIRNSPEDIQSYRNLYPDMQMFWHDPRIRKELVLAIVRAESSFRQNAVSPAGAKGLMQIMDGTAIQTGALAGINIDLRQVASNGNYNIAVGSKIVGDLMERYNGNVILMAAGYNAGPAKPDEWIRRFGDPRSGAIDPVDWIELVPYGETRLYIKRVISNYVLYLSMSSLGV